MTWRIIEALLLVLMTYAWPEHRTPQGAHRRKTPTNASTPRKLSRFGQAALDEPQQLVTERATEAVPFEHVRIVFIVCIVKGIFGLCKSSFLH